MLVGLKVAESNIVGPTCKFLFILLSLSWTVKHDFKRTNTFYSCIVYIQPETNNTFGLHLYFSIVKAESYGEMKTRTNSKLRKCNQLYILT